MLNWLIRVLGGVPEEEYEKILQENIALKEQCISMQDYATIDFTNTTEDCTFFVNVPSPNTLLVKKGTTLRIAGYQGKVLAQNLDVQQQEEGKGGEA